MAHQIQAFIIAHKLIIACAIAGLILGLLLG